MKNRVLILSASVGNGHVRAAEALVGAFHEAHPEVHVEHFDVLTFTNALFRRIYAKAYLDLVNWAPHVLGYLYDWLDQPVRTLGRTSDRFRLAFEKLNLKKFETFLAQNHYDVIVNTHFLPAALIATLRREQGYRTPQATVCTDFATHRLWVNPPCEKYFCAISEGADYLVYWGVPADAIEVTGIPIAPAFRRPYDRQALRHRLHLVDDRPVVLQLCGGFGVGPVEALFRSILEVQAPMQLVVVCGKNEALRERLSREAIPPRHHVKCLGYTTTMEEWMACADVVVSKPGGLTTSEALALGVPLVIVNPIPGQETRNSDFILENGAGMKIQHPCLLPHKLSSLLSEPERLQRMRQAAQTLGRPNAAFDVAARALTLT